MQIWSHDLDEVHLELFNRLRESHNQDEIVHSKDAVTAITVVALPRNDKPKIRTHVYFIPAIVFGKDVTDLRTCKPFGWRVTSLHLYNAKLRAMVESKWRQSHPANNNGLPHTVFRGNDLRRISIGDICAYDHQPGGILIEARDLESKRSLIISYQGVSEKVATFSEALNSEV